MGESLEQVMARYDAIVLSSLPLVSQQAINKLKASKTNDNTKNIMILLCLAIADGDEHLAGKVMSEQEKTLDTCFKHIMEWAKKKAVNGCATINHEEVCSEAIHYYTEVNEKKPVSLPVRQFVPPTEIEKPVEDGTMSLFGDDDYEEPEKDTVSMSLFGDDF